MPETTSPVLRVTSLSLGFAGAASPHAWFEPVDLELSSGEAAVVLGPTASGKTLFALALLDRLPPGIAVVSGAIVLGDRPERDVLADPGLVAFVPAVAKDVFAKATKIGVQIADAVRVAEGTTSATARRRANEWLELSGFFDPHQTYERFIFDLSFGEARAAAFALMFAYRPSLLIADNPRWGLSHGRWRRLLSLARHEQAERGMASLWLNPVPLPEVMADHQLRLEPRENERSEDDGQRTVFDLARPRPSDPGSVAPTSPRVALEATHLSAVAETRGLWMKRKKTFPLFEDVSLHVQTGEVVGILGASGSGKSALAETLCGWRAPSHGRILTRRGGAPLESAGRLGLVHQNPHAVLDPDTTVSELVGANHGFNLLSALGAPDTLVSHFVGMLSTGELALVSLSRTLARGDRVVVLDDPTGPLDEASKGHFAEVLKDLKRRGSACIMISYEPEELRRTTDRVLVLLSGRVVETGPTASVLARPRHPLTRALLDADGAQVPYEAETPRGIAGCPFAPHCPRRMDELCEREAPALLGPSEHELVACHNPLV